MRGCVGALPTMDSPLWLPLTSQRECRVGGSVWASYEADRKTNPHGNLRVSVKVGSAQGVLRSLSPSKGRRGWSLVRVLCGGRAVAPGICGLCLALGPACPRASLPFSMPAPPRILCVHTPPSLCRHAPILTCPWLPLIHQDPPIPSFLGKPSLASAPEPD